MEWLSILIPAAIALFKYAYDREENRRQSIIDEKNNSDQLLLAEKQLKLNETTSQQNFDLSKEQFEYQKQLNEITMQREDNAIQRQVADLKAAGLSPLMVAGGSSATPLQSAQPVQKDISGINTALSNMIGAYNDINNRRLNRQQFSMQNKLQSAQTFANILETSAQIKKAKLENQILDLDYKYFLNHPERNLGLQQVIVNALERIISRNPSSINPGLPEIKLPGTKSEGSGLFDLLNPGENNNIPDPVTFGIVNPSSKYGHTLDNENYDNNRKTATLIKDEIKEKYYKNQIKTAIAGDNDYSDLLPKLYKNDDYLKKHISLENWKKAKEDFILYYLKYGQFEGHKKYFD